MTRSEISPFAHDSADAAADPAVERLWRPVHARIDAFRALIAAADQAALREGAVPEGLRRQIQGAYLEFQHFTAALLGDASGEPEAAREAVGRRMQAELLPYLLMTENGERWYAKPRGYAGDFDSIARIYRDEARGVGRVGPVLDRCFLDMPAAVAVKNRRALLAREIDAALAEAGDRPARVTSLACGPAAELFDVYERLADPGRLLSTCLDIDLQALAAVADARDRRRLRKVMALEHENLVHLATGRRRLELPPQDLIYSVGLIDYLPDDLVVKLLGWARGVLRPGGRLILGNFHPRNPSKVLQDYLLDWRLIHRDEADLDRLAAASDFGRPCDRIFAEEQGINLFAVCTRR